MRIITSHRGLLQTLADHADGPTAGRRSFMTGLPALDALPPGGAFARGAVHEALSDPGRCPPPRSFALLLARSALCGDPADPFGDDGAGLVVWSDPLADLYAPAVAAGGVPLDRLLLLRPPSPREELWAVAECLRCPGRGRRRRRHPQASPASRHAGSNSPPSAAGAPGVLLRPWGRADVVRRRHPLARRPPIPAMRPCNDGTIQLIHGHGGQVGQSRHCWRPTRETNAVRAVEQLADRPAAATLFPRRAGG